MPERPSFFPSALVTGASRGIGRAVAHALCRQGIHVYALARSQQALEALDDEAQASGGSMSLIPLDLKDGAGIDRLPGAILERTGRLDMFAACAGALGGLWPVAQASPRLWDDAIGVNLTANARLIRALDPLLRAGPHGRAVFLTSSAASAIRPFWGPYAASKAGLEALVKSYAEEIKPLFLKANLFDPGPVATKMRAQAYPGEDQAILPTPDDIAPMILELLSPSCAMNGQIVRAPRPFQKAAAASS